MNQQELVDGYLKERQEICDIVGPHTSWSHLVFNSTLPEIIRDFVEALTVRNEMFYKLEKEHAEVLSTLSKAFKAMGKLPPKNFGMDVGECIDSMRLEIEDMERCYESIDKLNKVILSFDAVEAGVELDPKYVIMSPDRKVEILKRGAIDGLADAKVFENTLESIEYKVLSLLRPHMSEVYEGKTILELLDVLETEMNNQEDGQDG